MTGATSSAHMWGSEPAAWRDDLEGWARLRVIVNAMTRMRFCTPDGVMDFRGRGEQGAGGCIPWFGFRVGVAPIAC